MKNTDREQKRAIVLRAPFGSGIAIQIDVVVDTANHETRARAGTRDEYGRFHQWDIGPAELWNLRWVLEGAVPACERSAEEDKPQTERGGSR